MLGFPFANMIVVLIFVFVIPSILAVPLPSNSSAIPIASSILLSSTSTTTVAQIDASPTTSFQDPNASNNNDLPIVELPYGSFRATKYVIDIDTYIFKNVRFAAPPTGPLRFARPQPPAPNATLSDGSYGPQCIQSLSIANIPGLDLAGILNFGDRPSLIGPILDKLQPLVLEIGRSGALDDIEALLKPLLGPGGLLSDFPGEIGDLLDGLSGVLGLAQDEDCLFLDVYVPGKAIRKEVAPLPVAHWIYGGAYIFGSKDGLYDGFSLIEQSQGNLIFVASNYRMGAYGFLAGRTAEQANATNLGLYDQHAALQWIQDQIGLFGGDKTRVTAMGESAGAGSIMHQLTAFGGKQDPLFRKAIVQSPAFLPAIDRDGLLETTFKAFEREAGCAGKGLACLSTVSVAAIAKANENVIKAAPPGSFAFGPSSDGAFVRQAPSIEYYTGNFFQGMESLIMSHTTNEAYMFANPDIKTQQQLDEFEQSLLPNFAPVQDLILNHTRSFPDAQSALNELIQGSSFTCNVRYMTQNFAGKTWNMQYSKGRGTHGADILPTFFSKNSALTSLVGVINPDVKKIGPPLQSYFASYITTGDPNAARASNIPDLPKPSDSNANALSPILNVDDAFTLADDQDTTLNECDFWRNVEAGATNLLGYAPPDGVGQSTIQASNPSANFFSPRAGNVTAASVKVYQNLGIGSRPRVGATVLLPLLAVLMCY